MKESCLDGMTTKRHQKSVTKALETRDGLVEYSIDCQHKNFPKANKWVIFSAVGGQREAGIGVDSDRLRRFQEQYERFLDTGQLPDIEDAKICNTRDELRSALIDFYESHRWMEGPLCVMGSSDPEAEIGYEYFWTE